MKVSLILLLVQIIVVFAAAPRPTVIWHGMGDSCCNAGSMGKVKSTIEQALPGVYVHSVMVGDNPLDDTVKGFLDNANRQVQEQCQRLKADPKLKDGFNAVGFSQGGELLRAYIQRCNDPPVYNLVTMGAQHQGVLDIPGCVGYNETLCEMMTKLLAKGAYAPIIRDNLIQAQYFKDPYNISVYLEANPFLPDINNERATKNPVYAQRLSTLNHLALFRFTQDITVVPRDSAWFSFYNGSVLLPLRDQDIYKQDWIGLKALDVQNRLSFHDAPGGHMHFTLDFLRQQVITPFLNNTY